MNMRKNVLAAALALGGIAFASVAISAEAPAAAPQAQMNASAMNWFGGETYLGAPALDVTAALVKAGGGADNFSFSTALVSMLGEKTVNAEVAKLTKQYGHENVTNFINGMTFAVNDGLKRATEAGVTLPAAPADLKGAKLAGTLVSAGTAADGSWWSGLLFDKALSHDIHVKVMQDIDAKYGHGADENTHKILNQAMYDVAQALKAKNVKLASLH
ncbi:MAG: hypothetical protein J0I71_07785 [Rhodanobacter sp.]|nr:hypothetical protein [Rhodanobacter sp.]ODT95583.1 MAG: hypothetical protein ABS82_07685 [Rhodanobacter sp. SCN 67-45]OJW40165.1 MAG: hypothetical protein BGO50_14940 [Rhodanobacter sp. 67-28]